MQDNNSVLNKIVLITGSTSGIGMATAFEMVLHSATLILPVRSLEKGEILKSKLLELNKECHIDLYLCDFSSIDSIKTFLSGVKARYKKIDILINNAGVINYDKQKTVFNLENVQSLRSQSSKTLEVASQMFGLFKIFRSHFPPS